MTILLLITLLVGSAEDCIPAQTKIPIPSEISMASYVRVHPSGKYLLITSNDKVFIVELIYRDGKYSTKIYKTSLKKEAYPVEPDWKFISSPYHNGKMRYFKLDDILQLQDKLQEHHEVYSDEHNEHYHSSGGQENHFRTTLWNYQSTRDYKIVNNSIEPSSSRYHVCKNLFNLPLKDHNFMDWFLERSSFIYGLVMRIEAKIATSKMKSQSKPHETHDLIALKRFKAERDAGTITQEDFKNLKKIYTSPLEDRMNFFKNKHILTKPILSPDGTSIGGEYGGTTKFFRINEDNTCEEISNTGLRTSKVSFSYKNPSEKYPRYATFNTIFNNATEDEQTNGVYLHDLKKKTNHLLVNTKNSTSYSNFTKDGRVIYTNYHMGNGHIYILDPYQVSDGEIGKNCVSKKILDNIYGAQGFQKNTTPVDN